MLRPPDCFQLHIKRVFSSPFGGEKHGWGSGSRNCSGLWLRPLLVDIEGCGWGSGLSTCFCSPSHWQATGPRVRHLHSAEPGRTGLISKQTLRKNPALLRAALCGVAACPWPFPAGSPPTPIPPVILPLVPRYPGKSERVVRKIPNSDFFPTEMRTRVSSLWKTPEFIQALDPLALTLRGRLGRGIEGEVHGLSSGKVKSLLLKSRRLQVLESR